MVAHPGEPLDHGRDAFDGPQLADEPVGDRALTQGLLDLDQLGVRQARRGAGRAPACKGVGAASLPGGMPAAGGLAGDAQLAGNLGGVDAAGEQLGGP
jgi:hypothetical protein